jgi:hypothetical protein
MSLVVAVYSHRVLKAGFELHLLRAVVGGPLAFAAFCFAVAVQLPQTSTAYAFALTLFAALAIPGMLFRIKYRGTATRSQVG